MSTFDDYIATVKPAHRTEFECIRSIVKQTVPSSEEGTSYGMPAFMYRGKPFLSFAVRKKFLSLYPFSGKVIDRLRDKLVDFETTSGSIHFSETHPISGSLLKEIIAVRLQEIEERNPGA